MTTPHKALLRQACDALDNLLACEDKCRCSGRLTIAALQAAIDAPEPEPVAWIGDSPTKGNGRRLFWSRSEAYRYASNITPLYTHLPAVREPLTRQALKAVIASVPEPDDDHVGKWVVAVCRAVEAAHGIGVKP